MKTTFEVTSAPPQHWVGDGFPVRSYVSPGASRLETSPFLLLDYAAPHFFAPTDEPRGVGEHPHRGFETVTLAWQGEVDHRDSAGSTGTIGPGDVQWMTAASGVVHEEFHGKGLTRNGGTFEMAQIWVNLPAVHKMSKPGYQAITSRQIPVVNLPDQAGSLRVVAGEYDGAKGPARTFTPIHLWDLTLDAGARVSLPVPDGHSALILVRSGAVLLADGTSVGEHKLAVLDLSGEGVFLETTPGAKVLLLGGEPIREPVVAHGPFVMNTRQEISQAVLDFQQGRMGRL